jgi:hypothetical protein
MMIGDGFTQGAHVVGHAFHLTTIVANTKITLLEDMKLCVDLQNAGLTVTK